MYGGRREEYRMQMDGRLNRLLSVLSEDLYINMETVADQLEVSERTARTLVSQLDELLCRNGAAIERRRGTGALSGVYKGKNLSPASGDRKREDRIYSGPIICRCFRSEGGGALRTALYIQKNVVP